MFPPTLAGWHSAELSPLQTDAPSARAILADLGGRTGPDGILKRIVLAVMNSKAIDIRRAKSTAQKPSAHASKIWLLRRRLAVVEQVRIVLGADALLEVPVRTLVLPQRAMVSTVGCRRFRSNVPVMRERLWSAIHAKLSPALKGPP